MSPYPLPSPEAMRQREMTGVRSEIDALRRQFHTELTELRKELRAGFEATSALQNATNGRLRAAEIELERAKAREQERQRLAGLRENRLDRTLAIVRWGIGAMLSLAVAVAGWLIAAAG